VVAGLAAAVAVLGVDTGHTAFPGKNGRIVYGAIGECSDREPAENCFGFYLESVDPRRPGRARVLTCQQVQCLAGDPAFSPDGEMLAYEDGPDELFVARADGSRPRMVLDDASSPTWSPDGRRLAFRRDVFPNRRKPSDLELHVVGLDGKRPRRLTYGGGGSPDWSSRGEIAFIRLDRRYRADVYIMDGDGSDVRRLTRGRRSDNPSWSPDGRRLAIETRVHGRTNIVVIDRRGRRIRTVTRRGGHSPAWSPDGSRIAFNRRFSLYTVRVRGGGLRRIVTRGRLNGIDWQPRRKR